uniref:SHR-BD domain-containing protein n=1 Tax=Globodera pallida TaxID=36090 RepID=A0A183C2L8_GLOPA
MRVVLLRDASFDVWFMRGGELESMSSTLKQGSTLEFIFPWTTAENGSTVSVTGSFLRVETITSLPFRKFFACETLSFNLSANFPRAFNRQQQWEFTLELHDVLLNFIWDHKRFISELIGQWASINQSDLCNFSPFICAFKINVLEKFNILLLLNDKNWVDVSSMDQSEENLLGSVQGSRFYFNFDMDFTEFAPKTIPTNFKVKMEEKLSFNVRVPDNCALRVPFIELLKSANLSEEWANVGQEWVELWRTDSISCNLEYEYHPKGHGNFCRSPIPSKYLDALVPPRPQHPLNCFVPLVNINKIVVELKKTHTEAQIQVVTSPIKIQFDDSSNSWASISAIRFRARSLCSDCDVPWRIEYEEYAWLTEVVVGECLAQMNVADLVSTLHFLESAHFFLSCTDEETEVPQRFKIFNCFVPLVNINKIVVELKKTHTEAQIQVVTMPSVFRARSLCPIGDVPWRIEYEEYAWLTEVVVGECLAQMKVADLVSTLHFLESAFFFLSCTDEETEVPQRFKICQHFQLAKNCATNAKIDQTANNSFHCPSAEDLKYRHNRVSVDSVQLFLFADAQQTLLLLEMPKGIRISHCNFHLGMPTSRGTKKMGRCWVIDEQILEVLPNSFSDFVPFVSIDDKGVPLKMFARSLIFPQIACVLSTETDFDSPFEDEKDHPFFQKESNANSFQAQNERVFASTSNKYATDLHRYSKFVDLYSLEEERHPFFALRSLRMNSESLRGLKRRKADYAEEGHFGRTIALFGGSDGAFGSSDESALSSDGQTVGGKSH